MAMSGLCSVGLSDKATIFILTSDTKLKVPRVGHDSVVWDNYIVIVGGEGVRKHEIWEWREDEQDFDVFISKTPVNDYSYYPSVFALNPFDHPNQ